jgi:hypothetical protein
MYPIFIKTIKKCFFFKPLKPNGYISLKATPDIQTFYASNHTHFLQWFTQVLTAVYPKTLSIVSSLLDGKRNCPKRFVDVVYF